MKHLLLAALVAALPLHASAQTRSTLTVQCAATAGYLKMLETKYKEKVIGTGLSAAGDLVQVFASESGSFTVVANNAQRPKLHCFQRR